MKLLLFITAFLSAGLQASAHATSPCANLLSGTSLGAKADGTNGLIAYLSELLEANLIGATELQRLIAAAEKGQLSNPIREEQTWTSSNALIHREEIQRYLDGTSLSPNRILEWCRSYLTKNEHRKVRREATKVETQSLHQRMEFNLVPQGTFQMGEKKTKVQVNLTHPFEMMSTLVTQKQWAEVMGENPAVHFNGDHTIAVMMLGSSVKMQPDNPVEHITWWSAIEYANRLSVKLGLQPAYDLSEIKFQPGTRAENGTLKAESGQLKINAANGDIYRAEGLRLPTEAEYEYVLKNAGKANTNYFFGDDEAELRDYAWLIINSGDKTHPVAQLKPYVINGKNFYDLNGNVWELIHDLHSANLIGGDNPIGINTGSDPAMRGGSYGSPEYGMRSAYRGRHFGGTGNGKSHIGFRLVRTADIGPGANP